MALDIVGLVAAFALLTVSGDVFVVGVARIAEARRMRPAVVGALVGGLGTAVPELIVSSIATVRHVPDIAVGNLVGSIIANVALGLGLAALVAPIHVDSRTVRREAPLSVVAVALFAVLVAVGLGRAEAVVAVLALVGALVLLIAGAQRAPASDELARETVDYFGAPPPAVSAADVAHTVLSLLAMLGGAELLVFTATRVAERIGLAEGAVGLTVVAVGTSAPLIASGIAAVRRGDHDLVIGNALGCNLFIGLLGGALVGALGGASAGAVPGISVVMMVAVVVAMWAFMARGRTVTRWEGAILLILLVVMLPFIT